MSARDVMHYACHLKVASDRGWGVHYVAGTSDIFAYSIALIWNLSIVI